MPSLVPSKAARFIRETYGWVKADTPQTRGAVHLTAANAILALVDAGPDEITAVLSADDHVRYVAVRETLRGVVTAWRSAGASSNACLNELSALGGRHPLRVLYQLLSGLPDDVPPAGTRPLAPAPPPVGGTWFLLDSVRTFGAWGALYHVAVTVPHAPSPAPPGELVGRTHDGHTVTASAHVDSYAHPKVKLGFVRSAPARPCSSRSA